jgi:hypothetical protein
MEPKNILESLLKENIEMINEITEITKGDYQTGYIQALLTLPCSSHAPLHVFPKVYTKS